MKQIINTTEQEIKDITALQRDYFKSGATLPYKFREQQLKKLLAAMNKWEKQ